MKRIGKYFYYRFIRIRSSPQEMARGMFIGLFIAFTPTFGVQSITSIFFAALFRGNKILAGLAPFVTNPLTMPFLYGGTYLAGAAVLQSPVDPGFLSKPSLKGLWEVGGDVFMALWVGGVLVGFVVGLMGYFLALTLGPKIQKRFARNGKRIKSRSGSVA
ncbi:MAG: DUF2062 domain-containing protein [Nitrospinales bacterium]